MIPKLSGRCSTALLMTGLMAWTPALLARELNLDPVVVTTATMDTPHEVTTDPRRPHSTLPAQDGAAYLESITGFNVSRKGGTSGEPVLRGMGGSRLNISANGGVIGGSCPGRMDPPTAYIFPQSYDRVEVTKGPQSVRYGPATAGSVRFERDTPEFPEPATRGFASFTGGSYARNDLATDITTGSEDGYIRFIGTQSSQDDYDDGDGETVHSEHERWSTSAIAGWTPDADTAVELTYDRSNAEAAYDDRPMDGTDFDRTGVRLKASRENIAPWLPRVEADFFYNNIDHLMDNFRLRDPGTTTMARNVERRTRGGRLAADLALPAETRLHTGVDFSGSDHGDSGPIMAMGDPLAGANFRDVPTADTAAFNDVGLFVEAESPLGERAWMTLGLRGDYHEAEVLADNFGGAQDGDTDYRNQWSGFGRYEQALAQLPLTLHAGLGHSERAPDFWERDRDFDIENESLTQLDAGLALEHHRVQGTLTVFQGWYDDYILITNGGADARNVDAITRGIEAEMSVSLTSRWTLSSTLAYTQGTNDTDDTDLAQMPPLEGTLGLDYETSDYSAGLLWRGVDRQDRIDPNNGTIYSLDSGETPGFGTLSLHGGLRLFEQTWLTAGIDNVLDRDYAEHIQRGSADLGASDEPIDEPGRVLWANVSVEF